MNYLFFRPKPDIVLPMDTNKVKIFTTELMKYARTAMINTEYLKAEITIKQVLKIAPENTEALFLLAMAYKDQQKFRDATAILESSMQRFERNHMFPFGMALVYRDMDEIDQAYNHLQKAMALGMMTPPTYELLGTLAKMSGKIDEAIEHFQKALSLKPDYFSAIASLGQLYLEMGNKEKVLSLAANTIAKYPNMYLAYYQLTRAKKFSRQDAVTRRMEKMFKRKDTPVFGKILLGYALGKIFEDIQEYETAFSYFSEANRLQRGTYGYSTDESARLVDRLKSFFNEARIEQLRDQGYPDKTPIFIVGMPRSGTSLTEQILASHPMVFGAGELKEMHKIIRRTKITPDLDAETLIGIGKRYVENIRKFDKDAVHITDKQPSNFYNLGFILCALPNAKIIHCRRDPMDNCLSNLKNYFEKGNLWANDITEVGEEHLLYQDLMAHWHKCFPGKIYDLNYEALVTDQEAETKRLLAYCELPWDDACLAFHTNSRTVMTPSSMQVRETIYKSSTHAWKHFEKQLEPLRITLQGERPQTKGD